MLTPCYVNLFIFQVVLSYSHCRSSAYWISISFFQPRVIFISHICMHLSHYVNFAAPTNKPRETLEVYKQRFMNEV